MSWLILIIYFLWLIFTYLRGEYFVLSPPYKFIGKRKRKLIVAGFDMWIGLYLDRENQAAYWFPVPCIGLKHWWVGQRIAEGGL